MNVEQVLTGYFKDTTSKVIGKPKYPITFVSVLTYKFHLDTR